MFTKEGKLFGKISIIDIIVVLAIAILAFGVYVKFIAPPETRVAKQQPTFEYTVEVKEVQMGTVNALKKLGSVRPDITKVSMGEITEVTYAPAIRSQVLSDGTIENLEVPDRYTATIKIVGKGKLHKNGTVYSPDNEAKFLGNMLYFHTKYIKTSGKIMDIKQLDK